MGARDLDKNAGLVLSVGRWGNSLAVRLPADLARQMGVGEGGTLTVERQSDNSLRVSAVAQPIPMATDEWLAGAKALRQRMPRAPSAIAVARESARD